MIYPPQEALFPPGDLVERAADVAQDRDSSELTGECGVETGQEIGTVD
jgi:hypothetical protein